MNGFFPLLGFLLGWLERQGNFTAILTVFGIFFLAVYLWRTSLSNRRAKQKAGAAAKEDPSVDFKNPYSTEDPPPKPDPVGKSFDRMLSPPDHPPSRAFRVYVPHSNAGEEEAGESSEDANRVYIWE